MDVHDIQPTAGSAATESKCAECGKVAGQKCSRCQVVSYCGRECQVKHWTTHKTVCVDPRAEEKRRASWLIYAGGRISGNIYIMVAHKYDTMGSGVVFVEIDETIEEFMKGGSMHFAHLSFAPEDSYRDFSREKYNLELGAVSNLTITSVTVVYVLKNYHIVTNMSIEGAADLALLKKNYPDPDNDWAVLFTM